jgi:hypothetical protein
MTSLHINFSYQVYIRLRDDESFLDFKQPRCYPHPFASSLHQNVAHRKASGIETRCTAPLRPNHLYSERRTVLGVIELSLVRLGRGEHSGNMSTRLIITQRFTIGTDILIDRWRPYEYQAFHIESRREVRFLGESSQTRQLFTTSRPPIHHNAPTTSRLYAPAVSRTPCTGG